MKILNLIGKYPKIRNKNESLIKALDATVQVETSRYGRISNARLDANSIEFDNSP